MKQRRTAARLRCVSLRKIPLSMLALAAFFFSARSSAAWSPRARASAMGGELSRYLGATLPCASRARPPLRQSGRRWSAFSAQARRCSCWGFASHRRGAHSGGVCRPGLPVRLFASLLRLGSGAGWIFPAACSLRAAADACAALYAAARQRRVGDLARSCGPYRSAAESGRRGVTYGKRCGPALGSRVCLFFWRGAGAVVHSRILSLCCADLTEGGVPDGVRLSELYVRIICARKSTLPKIRSAPIFATYASFPSTLPPSR